MGGYLAVAAGASCIGGNAIATTVFIGDDILGRNLGFNTGGSELLPDSNGYISEGYNSYPLPPGALVKSRGGVYVDYGYNGYLGNFVGQFVRSTGLGPYGYVSTQVSNSVAAVSQFFYPVITDQSSRLTHNGIIEGSDNYISFDADGDGVVDTVIQIDTLANGGGEFSTIIGIAAIVSNNALTPFNGFTGPGNGQELTVAEAVAAIAAADAIPEVSSLALLALGSVGLVARRRRTAA